LPARVLGQQGDDRVGELTGLEQARECATFLDTLVESLDVAADHLRAIPDVRAR
jgi:hypothetical protein